MAMYLSSIQYPLPKPPATPTLHPLVILQLLGADVWVKLLRKKCIYMLIIFCIYVPFVLKILS